MKKLAIMPKLDDETTIMRNKRNSPCCAEMIEFGRLVSELNSPRIPLDTTVVLV